MKHYRLQSTAGVYAPGCIKIAQQLHREGDVERARDVVNAWPGIPATVVDQILAGAVGTSVDSTEALIVFVPDDEDAAGENVDVGNSLSDAVTR